RKHEESPAARTAGSVDRSLSSAAGCDLGPATVEILAARFDQFIDLVLVEMVGALDGLLLDGDALLQLELVDQLLHRFGRGHAVLVAVDDQARGRAGGEEGEIVKVFRGG